MIEGNKYLVVVSILEGRNFPRRANRQLSIEARFDGEHLATDPVEHKEQPDITQELAWELDKKTLHQHRLQRSPIKLLCYAVDKTVNAAKEEIGYVVLDLRSAYNKQPAKWYPLLHTKYSKLKPELRLCIYAEKDKDAGSRGGQVETTTHLAAGDACSTPSAKSLDVAELKLVLNETEGYYQLGPDDSNASVFVLSVTIVSAENLIQLVPSSSSSAATCLDSHGFYFFYVLFGNDVLTQSFLDVVSPNFAAERASIRIHCQPDVLLLFLEHQPPLHVSLCSGDFSIATSELSMEELWKGRSIPSQGCSFESMLELQPTARVRDHLAPIPADSRPTVTVTVLVRSEAVTISSENAVKQQSPVPGASVTEPEGGARGAAQESAELRGERGTANACGDSETSYSSQFSDSGAAENTRLSETRATRQRAAPLADGDVCSDSGDDEPPLSSLASALTTTSEHTAVIAQPRHFRCSVHLESVSHVDVANVTHVYLRYSYPHFGSAAPVMTHPAVEVRKGITVTLPQSFCAFHFSMTAQQLRETLMTYPLKMELWEQDKSAGNRLIASGELSLQRLLATTGHKIKAADGRAATQYTRSDSLALMVADGREKVKRVMARLQFTLTLDDFGDVPAHLVVVEDRSGGAGVMPGAVKRAPKSSLSPGQRQVGGAAAVAPELTRQTAEYHAALELEVWKAVQEEAFERQLREKEAEHMTALAEEWKRRDLERETLTKKKLAEYSQLEQQVQKLLADVARRERELALKEQEVERQRSSLQHDFERKMVELKGMSRRVEQDCEQRVELARMKTVEHEGQLARLKQDLSEAERKYQSIDREFAAYREQQSGKPEVRLQSEINLLTLEKVELERKLEAAAKSKLHYKQQWGRTLKELARLKEQEQAEARTDLRRRQQELEHMRLRYLAAEEGDVIKSDRRQLDEVKAELSRLKEIEEEKLRVQKQQQAAGGTSSEHAQQQHAGQQQPALAVPAAAKASGGRVSSLVEDAMEERVARLIEERDTLLRTGVYTTGDRIIVELDRQIRDAISRHNTAAMASVTKGASQT